MAGGVPSPEQPQRQAAMAKSLRAAPCCAMCGALEAFLATAPQTQPANLLAAAPRPKQAQRPFIPFAFSELFWLVEYFSKYCKSCRNPNLSQKCKK
jgi:hypothetical protein